MKIEFGEFVRLFNIEDRNNWLIGLRVDQYGVWKGSIKKRAMDLLTACEIAELAQIMEVEETCPILKFPATREGVNELLRHLGVNSEEFPDYHVAGLITCDGLLAKWCGNDFDKDAYKELSDGLVRLAQEEKIRIYDVKRGKYLKQEDVCEGFSFCGNERISFEDAEKARVLLGVRQHGADFVDWHGETFISVYGASLRIAWERYPEKVISEDTSDFIWIGFERERQYQALYNDINAGLLDVFDPEGERIRNGSIEDCSLMRLSDLNKWLAVNIPNIRIVPDSEVLQRHTEKTFIPVIHEPAQKAMQSLIAEDPLWDSILRSDLILDNPISKSVFDDPIALSKVRLNNQNNYKIKGILITELPSKRRKSAERLIKVVEEVLLNRMHEPPLTGQCAQRLHDVLIEYFGSLESVPKYHTFKEDLGKLIARVGKGSIEGLPSASVFRELIKYITT